MRVLALTLTIVGAALSLLVALLVAWILSRPIARLAEVARDMAQGQYSRPVPDERIYREAASLASALVHLQSTVLGQTEGSKSHKTRSLLFRHKRTRLLKNYCQ